MRGTNAAELVDDIERQVSEGILQPGARLPPVRTLAAEIGLAPNTVAAAYRRLGERGIVVGRGRMGSFVAARPPVALPAEPDLAAGLRDLARGNPDPMLLPPIPRHAATAGKPILYGHDSVDSRLRNLSVRGLGGDGVATDHLAIVSGALDGIERTLQAHLRAGDRIAVEDPAYASVIDLVGALGLVPVPVAIDDEGMRPGALQRVLVGGVSAVVLTPRAQNPYGSALSTSRAEELKAVLAQDLDVLLVEDDHAGAVAGVPFVTLVTADRMKWALIRSAAKSYGPDLRIALLAADATTIRRVEGRQALGPGWVSHMLQRTLAALMDDSSIDTLLANAARTYTDRRIGLIDALAARGITAHGRSGLNVWIPVVDEQAAVSGMRDRGLAVRAGERFRLRSEPGIRITVAALSAAEVPAIAEAVAEVVRGVGHATRSG